MTAGRGGEQGHAVGTRGLEHVGDRGDREPRAGLAQTDHIPGLEPRLARQALSVQEGAVPAPEILELPAGGPVTQLGVQRGHDVDVRPR